MNKTTSPPNPINYGIILSYPVFSPVNPAPAAPNREAMMAIPVADPRAAAPPAPSTALAPAATSGAAKPPVTPGKGTKGTDGYTNK